MDVRHEEAMMKFLASQAYAAHDYQRHPASHGPARVLVIWESKHGSTAEISYMIAGVLRAHGIEVTLADAAESFPDGEFDAYVIGSAVYAGHWMKRVKQYAHEFRKTLLAHPVWLFSSGPIGRPAKPEESPVDMADMFWCTAPKEHKIFGGNLDRAKLSFAERAIATALRAPAGDFRDWAAISAWASEISRALATKDAHA